MPDEDAVREAGNDPEDRRRDQRERKAEHDLQQLFVNIPEAEIAAVPRQHPDGDAGEKVGEHNREHKARNAELQPFDEDDIEDEQRERAENAVCGVQLHVIPRSGELRRELPEAGNDDISDQQNHIGADVLIQQQQRRQQDESACTAHQHDCRIREHRLLLVVFVKPVANDRVRDREADDRDQQVRTHFKDFLGVECAGVVEVGRIEPRQQECDQLGADVADRKNHGIDR